MSIYVKRGVNGQIKTTHLPSGDMAVSGPLSGPLEQIMFNACCRKGRRNPSHGGWIIPRASATGVSLTLGELCEKITD